MKLESVFNFVSAHQTAIMAFLGACATAATHVAHMAWNWWARNGGEEGLKNFYKTGQPTNGALNHRLPHRSRP